MFKLDMSIVIAAKTEEDALSALSARISTIARHLAHDGVTLADNQPFFTLTATDAGEPVDLRKDPVREAAVQAEIAKDEQALAAAKS